MEKKPEELFLVKGWREKIDDAEGIWVMYRGCIPTASPFITVVCITVEVGISSPRELLFHFQEPEVQSEDDSFYVMVDGFGVNKLILPGNREEHVFEVIDCDHGQLVLSYIRSQKPGTYMRQLD